jgi:hypothetical protein
MRKTNESIQAAKRTSRASTPSIASSSFLCSKKAPCQVRQPIKNITECPRNFRRTPLSLFSHLGTTETWTETVATKLWGPLVIYPRSCYAYSRRQDIARRNPLDQAVCGARLACRASTPIRVVFCSAAIVILSCREAENPSVGFMGTDPKPWVSCRTARSAA